MSRRHRENETVDNYKPHQVESHEDGHQKKSRFTIGASIFINNFLTIGKRDVTLSKFSVDKIIHSVVRAFSDKKIEVDDKWVKIPRSYFESSTENIGEFVTEKLEPPKKEPSFVKRLFSKIDNSELVRLFKSTLQEVKVKCIELYENVTQFAVCFLRGSNQAFTPDDDPYGKLSLYHRILEPDVENLQTRKTLNNYMKWFVDWRPVAEVKETVKEKKERFRHKIWKRLIEWIYNHLLEVVPQYAFT
jgi:hypothetical protein